MRVSVTPLSRGDPVQPAAKADQRAGGPEDLPDAYSSPHQRRSDQALARWPIDCSTDARSPACRRLHLRWASVSRVDGAAVPDRGVPVLARLGQPAEPAIQQAGHLHIVQDLLKPGQLHKLVLVAAARPTTIQPQQVTPDRGDRQTGRRCGERPAWTRPEASRVPTTLGLG